MSNASIYVGDLADGVTEDILRDTFSRAGTIHSVVCCRERGSGEFLHYGFVNYATTEAAKKALEDFRHVSILGQNVRVMLSQRDASARKSGLANIFVKNLHPELADDDALYNHFVNCGPITSAKVAKDADGNSKTVGFVQFEDIESADRAIELLDGVELQGRVLSVSQFVPAKEARRRSRKAAQSSATTPDGGAAGPSRRSDESRPSTSSSRPQPEAQGPQDQPEQAGPSSLPIVQADTSTSAALVRDDKQTSGLLQLVATQSRASLEQNLMNSLRENRRLQSIIEDLRRQLKAKERAAEDMLYEFTRLGKVQEANLKRPLIEIASFSLSQGGFAANKDAVVQLCEQVMNAARGGPVTAQDTARRFLRWGLRTHPHWKETGTPDYEEVVKAFADGQDQNTYITLPKDLFSHPRPISLQAISQMNGKVVAECYIRLIKLVQNHHLQVLADLTPAAQEGRLMIVKAVAAAVPLCLSWIIGQSTSFSAMRAIKEPAPTNPQEAVVTLVLSRLNLETRTRLWQTWDNFCMSALPLLTKKSTLEQHFDDCLAHLDVLGDTSLVYLLDIVKQLMDNYYSLLEASLVLDISCGMCCLSPLELGTMCGIQLPDLPADEIIRMDIDPYFRWSHYFMANAIPRN